MIVWRIKPIFKPFALNTRIHDINLGKNINLMHLNDLIIKHNQPKMPYVAHSDFLDWEK
jgi:hypothetical protein